jgi:biotin carboxylase
MSARETVARVLTERVLSISQAINEIDKATGVRPHRGTIHRWISRGVRGVKLDAVEIGSRTVTSAEAIHRFITARTASLQQ